MHTKFSGFEQLVQKEHRNIAGIAVLHNGETAYENYWGGCTEATTIHVFSITKSVISMLIGIALDKGHIQSIDTPVLKFFPGYTPKRGDKTIQKITIKHLLTMAAPYKYRSAPYTKYFTSEDWVSAALDLLGGKGPIGPFRYTPLIGPDILSGILQSATGQPVNRFAEAHLFGPLGISPKPNIVFKGKDDQFAFLKAKGVGGWVADPQGANTAGWGLTLTAMEMAKLGQLYLNGGAWQGRQLIAEKWVAESTKAHNYWAELGLPFGYLWWPTPEGFAAMGDSGNVIWVNTQKQLVIAIAALYKPTAKDRMELIRESIEPLFTA